MGPKYCVYICAMFSIGQLKKFLASILKKFEQIFFCFDLFEYHDLTMCKLSAEWNVVPGDGYVVMSVVMSVSGDGCVVMSVVMSVAGDWCVVKSDEGLRGMFPGSGYTLRVDFEVDTADLLVPLFQTAAVQFCWCINAVLGY